MLGLSHIRDALIIILLPSCAKIPTYRAVFGYKIGKDIQIGLAWIKVSRLEIADHVRIGHLIGSDEKPWRLL